MKVLFSIFKTRFKVLIQYRAAALAGFATQTFWGLIRIMILSGFYSTGPAASPLSLQQVITYIWLSQAMFAILPWSFDRDTATMIKSGNIAFELLRPVQLYSLWFARALAMRTANPLFRALPLILFSTIILPLIGLKQWALLPAAGGAAGLACFALSVCLALLLSAAITALMLTLLIWTVSAEGSLYFMPVLVWIFCGITLPLPLFPAWFQPLLHLLPFRFLMDVPIRIYCGNIIGLSIAGETGLQVLWVILLTLAGRLLLFRGTRKIQVLGG